MKTQKGRSMIEMLGVLAIIGVLSIGGLAGYTRAMNAHQANQIMDYFNRCSVAAQEQYGIKGSLTTTSCSGTTGFLAGDPCPVTSVAVAVGTGADANKIVITGTGTVDSGVCTSLTAKSGSGVTWSCATSTTNPTAKYNL
ncbi:MAG: hypothetical protein ILP11_03570 [Alphaproteobacteria bacterium]|nr:hypothetical protein [Alphaproteobacteria bacterium]